MSKKERADKHLPEEISLSSPDLTSELVSKVEREIKKAEDPYITPYTISQKYGIKVSSAKRILKLLKGKNLIRLVSHTRRVRVYRSVKERS